MIAGVVVLNGLIGFFQEHRAEQAIAALGKLVVTEATVVRDGVPRRVHSETLVAGDVVILHSGDTVPADLRLLSLKDLRVEEAALTGESVPSEKAVGVLPADTVLGDRTNLAFAGSAVVSARRAASWWRPGTAPRLVASRASWLGRSRSTHRSPPASRSSRSSSCG